ncbi:MAG TPA: hypothetical protein VGQ35_14720 [Dongiaceae bacterium]|jgi:hypothetical protein|nr:hypothetical protein [Dongiaceae bacterium]
MFKWIFLGIVVAIVVVIGGLFGFGRYVLQHANEPDSFSSKVYEQTVEAKMLTFCKQSVRANIAPDETNTQEQYDATCACFANDMFEKIRDVPPDELDAMIDEEETKESAQNIMMKCAYQSGLNVEN